MEEDSNMLCGKITAREHLTNPRGAAVANS